MQFFRTNLKSYIMGYKKYQNPRLKSNNIDESCTPVKQVAKKIVRYNYSAAPHLGVVVLPEQLHSDMHFCYFCKHLYQT